MIPTTGGEVWALPRLCRHCILGLAFDIVRWVRSGMLVCFSNRWMDGWMMARRKDGWMDGEQMDGGLTEWMDEQKHGSVAISVGVIGREILMSASMRAHGTTLDTGCRGCLYTHTVLHIHDTIQYHTILTYLLTVPRPQQSHRIPKSGARPTKEIRRWRESGEKKAQPNPISRFLNLDAEMRFRGT